MGLAFGKNVSLYSYHCWNEFVSQQSRLTVFGAVASVAALFVCNYLQLNKSKGLGEKESLVKSIINVQ